MGEEGASAPRFRVLGVTKVLDGSVNLGAPQQRSVLALLLLEAGRVVPLERLIDALWPVAPPATARKAIQVYVSHLRRALASVPGVEVLTVRPGYCVEVEPDDVDVHRFRGLVERARDVPVGEAARLLGGALDLWEGPAIADLPNGDARELLVAGLEEQRLIAWEDRVVAQLCLGRAHRVVCEVTEYVAAHPLRERGYRLLMRTLFYCGRQAEALAAFQEARAVLAERLGTEPGPEMRLLHEQLLHGRLEPDATLLAASGGRERLEAERPFGDLVCEPTLPQVPAGSVRAAY